MRVYLVRHGETSWNRERRIQGQVDVALNAAGVRQAHQCARFFRELPLAAAYSSTLSRAVRTAAVITSGTVPIQGESGLNERHFGTWQGRRWPEIYAEQTEWDESRIKRDPTFRPPGGESLVEMAARAIAAFVDILGRHPASESILITTHSGPLRAIVNHVTGRQWHELRGTTSPRNCSITVVRTTEPCTLERIDHVVGAD